MDRISYGQSFGFISQAQVTKLSLLTIKKAKPTSASLELSLMGMLTRFHDVVSTIERDLSLFTEYVQRSRGMSPNVGLKSFT